MLMNVLGFVSGVFLELEKEPGNYQSWDPKWVWFQTFSKSPLQQGYAYEILQNQSKINILSAQFGRKVISEIFLPANSLTLSGIR